MNIPKALADLLNKADPGFTPFAFALPTRVFRIARSDNACTFRVEQFVRTNKDNLNPQGTWRTISTHGSETPWGMCQTACTALVKTQTDFINKMNARMNAQAAALAQGPR